MCRAISGFLMMLCLVAGAARLSMADDKATPADNTAPEGYTALFNGKDLAGWKGLMKSPLDSPAKRAAAKPDELAAAQKEADEDMKAHWTVKEGVIEFDGKGRSLVTAKDYGDFELMVDWKIKEAGDSGIYLRGCPQIQIWDPGWKPYFQHGADKGSGALWNNKKNPRFPDAKADKPIGEWNTFHIKMVGDKVTVKLNGVMVVNDVTMENIWEADKPVYPTGQIELQNHGNTLYFKNIYIKELPAKK